MPKRLMLNILQYKSATQAVFNNTHHSPVQNAFGFGTPF